MEKNEFFLKDLGQDIMPISAFCSPQPEIEINGVKYPSKITLEQYEILAELGVNIVYGHAEKIGCDTEQFVFKALEYCEKCKVLYFVRDNIAEEYTALGNKRLPNFASLSEAEKIELDKRFEKSIKRYCHYKAFAGIIFCDEPGVDSFVGIKRAKDVFKNICPNKLFYVNMLPNNISGEQFQYGADFSGCPKCTIPELQIGIPNAERYQTFMKKYFEIVNPEVYSYDSYPFLSLDNVQTMIHISLYEIQQVCHKMQDEYGIPYWTFMQVGGKWEGSLCRVVDYAEMCLQINIALCYGARGLQLFPYCLPNDWLIKREDKQPIAGVVDAFGNKTDMYLYLKKIFKQVKAIQKYLMRANLKGIIISGKFKGLLPPEKELKKIKYNETIFRGNMPTFANIEIFNYGEIVNVEATSLCLISCFKYKDENLYFLVNNSIITAQNVKIKFDSDYEILSINDGMTENIFTKNKELYYQKISAGDSILFKVIKNIK